MNSIEKIGAAEQEVEVDLADFVFELHDKIRAAIVLEVPAALANVGVRVGHECRGIDGESGYQVISEVESGERVLPLQTPIPIEFHGSDKELNVRVRFAKQGSTASQGSDATNLAAPEVLSAVTPAPMTLADPVDVTVPADATSPCAGRLHDCLVSSPPTLAERTRLDLGKEPRSPHLDAYLEWMRNRPRATSYNASDPNYNPFREIE